LVDPQLKITGIFEEIAQEADLCAMKFEERHPFVGVGLLLSADAAVYPMRRRPVPLDDDSLNLKGQFRILTKQHLEKLQDPIPADEWLRFWKMQARIIAEKIRHLLEMAGGEQFKETGNGLFRRHQIYPPNRFLSGCGADDIQASRPRRLASKLFSWIPAKSMRVDVLDSGT
jgi:hypothetical protein